MIYDHNLLPELEPVARSTLPPEEGWRLWWLMGWRGSGKSHAAMALALAHLRTAGSLGLVIVAGGDSVQRYDRFLMASMADSLELRPALTRGTKHTGGGLLYWPSAGEARGWRGLQPSLLIWDEPRAEHAEELVGSLNLALTQSGRLPCSVLIVGGPGLSMPLAARQPIVDLVMAETGWPAKVLSVDASGSAYAPMRPRTPTVRPRRPAPTFDFRGDDPTWRKKD